MAEKTVRNYYALNWKSGYEFEYDYNTICDLEIPVAIIVAFNKKRYRDAYVDRRHSAESIPASIARKLARHIGAVYIEGDMKDDDMEH